MLEPLHEPIPVFLTLVTVILIMPLLSERVRLPGLIGLVLGGMLVGPHGTGLLSASGSIELLATVGLLYLMFSAGLEIDLRQLGRVRNKAMLFGLLTFLLPQLSGVALGRGFGLGWSAAVLLGSVYASHTLLAFPILSHLDILSNEAVAVTVGATLFTDVASLLVLGIVAGSGTGGGSASFIVQLIVLMGLFTILVLAVLPKLVRHFFHRFSGRAIKLQFVLVTLLLSAWVAEHIGMHAIIGAFLAGLAINSAVSAHSPVVGQVLYIGESLFIPMFLMYVGMITDPLAIVASRQALVVGLVLTAAVYLSKLGAAWIVGRIFGYSRDETLTMWGLSQAQAAATLATILVGVEIRLFPAHVFNGAILMIICTSVSSPLLTQKFGARLSPAEEEPEERGLFERIIVAVANPQTEQHLIALAGILACRSGGVLMPTNVARVVDGEVVGLERQRKLLNAPVVSDCQAEVQRIARVDASITEGVLHAALENEATLIVMGWRGRPTLAESIFGTVLDEVVWDATIPVLVGRMTTPIDALERVVLVTPAGSLPRGLAGRTSDMALTVARATNVPLLVLAAERYEATLREELARLDADYPHSVMRLGQNVVQDVRANVNARHLVMVTTTGPRLRFRSSLGRIPEHLAAETPGSVVVIHYP